MTGARTRVTSLLWIGVTALVATACAPAVLWSRHTGDRLTGVEARRKSGQIWLVASDRNGGAGARESARFDEIAFDEAVFSESGRHFAVAARRGDRWHILRDLAAGPAWEGVAALTFDGRGEHLAYAAQDHGRWRLVADGVAGPPHDAIGEPVAFSDDGGRLGYVAVDSGCARVVTAGVPGPCWRGISALTVGCRPETDTYVAIPVDGGAKVLVRGGVPLGEFDDVGALRAAGCGDRWAAVVRRQGDWQVLADGEAQPPAKRVTELAFGPGGRRLAYAVERDGWSMNVDGLEGDRFDSVGPPAFSPDGGHVGYLAERQGRRWLVIDGNIRAAAPAAFGLALGPDGRRFAYVAGSAARPAVVCDDVSYSFPLVVEHTVSFSRDGRHWGVLAGYPANRKLVVAVDGRPARHFDSAELFGSAAGGPPDRVPALLRGWVAAEMEILLAEAKRR